MVIKKESEILEVEVEEEGVKNVIRKILIGPEDGSQNIIMRHFKILPKGHTPYHQHPLEHVVKIVKGMGQIVSETGDEFLIREGQSVFVKSNEKHQFKNPFQEPFEFLCIILNPEKIP